MARPFAQIMQDPDFQAETPERKEQIRQDYFNEIIKPQVEADQGDVNQVYQSFLADHQFGAAQPEAAPAEAPPVNPSELQPHEMTDEQAQKVGEQTGVRPYNGIGSGIIDAVKGAVSGGAAAQGAAAQLPTVFDAPEMSAAEQSQPTGDALTDMVDHVLSRLKNTGQNMATGILGNDEDAISRAKMKGAKISQDEKGNTVASFPSGDYIINPPGLDVGDVTKFVGQTAPYIAATAATGGMSAMPVLGRMAATGGMDAAINVAEQGLAKTASGQELGDISGGEAAMTGLTSAATAGLAPVIGRAANAIKGKLTGQNTMTESAQKLLQAGEEAEVPLRTTEMYRAGELGPQSRMKEFAHNVSDTFGGPAKGARALNEAVENGNIRNMVGDSADIEKYTDEALIGSLNAGKQRRIAEMGAEYDDINAQMGNKPITLHNTIKAIDQTLDKWRKPGMTVDESDIKQLTKFRDQLEAGPQDLVMLRDNRTALRQELGSAMNKQLGKNRTVKAGSDIYDAMTKDLHAGVESSLGPAAAQRMKTVDKEWARFNEDLDANRVAQAIKNGDLNPEYVRKNMANWGSNDIKRIDGLLNEDGRKTLRAAIGKNLEDAATGADGNIAPAQFLRAYEKHKPLIDHYFAPVKVKQMEGLKKLMETSKGMKLANTLMNNGAITLPMLMSTLVVTQPLKAATGFVASRAYNTKLVRNSLLRLAGAKPGSMRYNHIVRSLEHAGREEGKQED